MEKVLLNNFLRISSIPRESGHEEKIADFFVEIAKQNNLYYFKDKYNNVLIKKPGTKVRSPYCYSSTFRHGMCKNCIQHT